MTKQEIIDATEEAFKIAERYYNRTFLRPTKFVWETNKTRAGYCNFSKKELGFNPILAQENSSTFLDTVKHEVAHWIDKEVYGYQKTPSGRRVMHGRTWKRIMVNVYRLNPDRCHTYDVSNVAARTRVVARAFTYSCPCNTTFNLTAVRHNKIASGKKYYTCVKCRGRIFLVKSKSAAELQMEKLQREIARLQALANKTQTSF
jgi:SprT protein